MDGDNAARLAEGGVGDPFEGDDSSSESSVCISSVNAFFNHYLPRIRGNDPLLMSLRLSGDHENVTNKAWAKIGRDISSNYELHELILSENSFNDQKISCLFRGLTRSSSIRQLWLTQNELSVNGIRSMVPFLQNANNLTRLALCNNNIKSEGFHMLFDALRDSRIEELNCNRCGIRSIEIHTEQIPINLKVLELGDNSINADGCRELAKFLQGEGVTLRELDLGDNDIDDEGVEILVEALQNNTALKKLDLRKNGGITNQGKMLLLQLVNDISSITATLQSNHTLRNVDIRVKGPDNIQRHIDRALTINKLFGGFSLVGTEKVIQFQLHSRNRAELAALQGIEHSVYSEIDPLHLPEVLSLLGQRGRLTEFRGELYVALRSTVVGLFSMVNMRQCIQNEAACCEAKIDEYEAKIDEYISKMNERGARLKELNARLETMDDSNQGKAENIEVEVHRRSGGNENNTELEHRSIKRRRKWWWGFWDKA